MPDITQTQRDFLSSPLGESDFAFHERSNARVLKLFAVTHDDNGSAPGTLNVACSTASCVHMEHASPSAELPSVK